MKLFEYVSACNPRRTKEVDLQSTKAKVKVKTLIYLPLWTHNPQRPF